MQTVIFGRPGCPYCVRAKDLAEKLSNERDDFQYQYVDIRAEGITKERSTTKRQVKPVENRAADFCRSATYRRLYRFCCMGERESGRLIV